MKLIIKKEENEKIKRSKEIIKKEKQKIKDEKKKLKKENKHQNKLINILKKIFKIKDRDTEVLSLKEQIFSMIYFEIIGAILCLLTLFVLSGGRNYIKLYKDLNKLISVYDSIQSDYYGKINKEELVNNAISSMLNSVGDEYTTYTDNKATDTFLEELEGTYEGIGCTVSMNTNGEIVIISIFDDSPAEEAGLQVEDIIIKIDGKDYSDKTSEDMANYIKTTTKSKIELIVRRQEQEKKITIKRKKVEIPSVTSNIIEKDQKKIGYIDISIFSSVTYNQFKKQLEELEEKNIEGIIIDVRNDTGGYLKSVTDITNLFLAKDQIIYQLENKKTKEKIKDTTKEKREYPIVVLINENSASASEILASAIKESYGGIVVGTKSYGKGTVQKTKTLTDGSMIKYTAQNWLTPQGNWINEIGVEPTVEVPLDFNSITDNQLDTAVLEIIKRLN